MTQKRWLSYLVEVFHAVDKRDAWEKLEKRARCSQVRVFFCDKAVFDTHAESWSLIETTEDVAKELREQGYLLFEAFRAVYYAPNGTKFVVEGRGTRVQWSTPSLDYFVKALEAQQDTI